MPSSFDPGAGPPVHVPAAQRLPETEAPWPLPPRYDHTESLLARAAAPGPMRELALRCWAAIVRDPGRAGFTLSHHLRRARGLRSWERKLVAAGLYAFVRHHRLLARLADAGWRDGAALWARWIAHQAGQGALAAEAAALLAPLEPLEQLMLAGSLPREPAARLLADLGPEALPFLRASFERAPLVVRANRARITRDALAERLADLDPEPLAEAPDALRLRRCDVFTRPEYLEGLMEVQDAGSQRLAALVNPQPGERVLDLCAGGGGKALYLAQDVEVFVHDIRPRRLDELERRAARLGLRVHRGLPADRVDVVLVDAPCSGSGTLRRDPCLIWRLDDVRVQGFVETQRALLEQALAHLRPGGRLVYGTCSVFRAEDEAVVAGFLGDHPRFGAGPSLRTGPHQGEGDGFFGAVFRA
ncbi:MAG: RsmB/NOP family class I SAM-dependent RNA methyltransferase [Alphaproteobacteria bacterium]|nr:RsmB/NOP family class I SAM-dependent RNA methyltransferase [Alphaproteobacteria bacterium]